MSSRVTFTGGRFHRYSLDGDWVPSVTSVTGKVGDKGGLVGGAAKEVAAWAAIHVDELPQLGEAESNLVHTGGTPREVERENADLRDLRLLCLDPEGSCREKNSSDETGEVQPRHLELPR